jgi:uncharacterized protein (TIGR02145 family)
MKKFLFSVCAVLAILGCGGENIECLPPLNPGRSDYDGGGNNGGVSCSNASFSSSGSAGNNGVSCPNASVSSGYVSCGGQSYRTVVVGTQRWMAENLNYDPGAGNSSCYGNNSSNCSTYGRLYDWSTAMNISTSYNSSSWNGSDFRHQGICPSGWHIPTQAEWNTLSSYVQSNSGCGSSCDAVMLKATSGWYNCGPSGSGNSYRCEDSYSFSALPGGHGYSDGYFSSAGNYGDWWSASEYNSYYAYFRTMRYYSENAYWNDYDKSYLFSVRCLQD